MARVEAAAHQAKQEVGAGKKELSCFVNCCCWTRCMLYGKSAQGVL